MKHKRILTTLSTTAALLLSASLIFSQNPQTPAPAAPKGGKGIKGSDAPFKGKFEKIRVHGKSLEGNLEGDSADRDVFVYLPPSYAANPNRRYPVVYFLHGYGIGAEAYWNMMTVPQSVDGALAAGAKEMILVHPDAFTVHNGSMYSNSPTTGDWEAFVAEELVTYIDSHYRTVATRGSRGIAGHSMGGYGAFRIGMKHPEVFSSLYPMSSCCLMNNPNSGLGGAVTTNSKGKAGGGTTPALAAAWSANPNNPPNFYDLPVVDGEYRADIGAKWYANSPLAMVDQYWSNLKKYKAIMIDVGLQDGLINGNKDMVTSLNRLGVKHVFETYEGDHTNHVRDRFETRVLPFFSQNLDFPR
ncbi:MAG: alpha/beta fold hydrolase [Bryobacteraceae bacterium]